MKRTCPNPNCAAPEFVRKDGFFYRSDDSKLIQRYRCRTCQLRFSNATFSENFRQKKRRINAPLMRFFSSGLSQRRSAILLNVDRKTIARKLPLLAKKSRKRNEKNLSRLKGRVFNLQIDDLITKDNSKLKPLSVTIAIDEDRRAILSAEVSKIPAFGHLSKIAIPKYGPRKDEHAQGLERTFERLKEFVVSEVRIKSDKHQMYPRFVSGYFPKGQHLTFESIPGPIPGG